MTLKIPEFIKELQDKYALWIVGGSVRDILMGKSPSDFDLIATDINMALKGLKKIGKIIALDEKEKEFRVVLGKNKWIDIGEIKGKSIEEDLMKRDFTVNSMAVSPKGKLIDPMGAAEDLKNKLLKTIREENIVIDPLRILRAFRFYATMGFHIEHNTLHYIKKHKDKLCHVAPERIRQEFLLILSSKNVYKTFDLMCKYKIMDVIFPEVRRLRETAQKYYNEQNLLHHSLLVLKYLEEMLYERNIPYEPIYLLGAFLHDIGKPFTISYDKEGNTHFYGHDKEGGKIIENRLKNLRFSSKEIEDTKKIVEFHMYPHHLAGIREVSKKAVARFLRKTEKYADFLLLFAVSDAEASPPREGGMAGYDELMKLVTQIRNEMKEKPKRLINGHDLIKLGFSPSPIFKTILDDINEEFMAGSLKDKEDALKYINKKYKTRREE